jgi:hypothetical protein
LQTTRPQVREPNTLTLEFILFEILLITDGIIKTKFVRTDDNTADIFTKNTSEILFVKHSDKLIEDLEELYEELLLCFEYSDDDDDDEYEF